MHQRLAEVDHLAIGPVGSVVAGEHGDGGGDDRQADLGDMGFHAADQLLQHLGRFGAAVAHVQMRVGAIADEGVDRVDTGVGHVGVQVEAGDDRHAGADDTADHGLDCAFGVVIPGGQAGAVHDAVDAVDFAGGAQAGFPLGHQAIEECLVDRAVRLGHGEQQGNGIPRLRLIVLADEAGQFTQHARGRAARVGKDIVAAQQRANGEVVLGGDRGEAVALDREAQQGDARPICFRHYSSTPSISAMRGVAFNPVPVSTNTVFSLGLMAPVSNRQRKAASAWAQVGST